MTGKFNAANCPITAAFVLAFRAEFGEATVTYLSENGVEHGTPSGGEYVQPVLSNERSENAELGGGKYLGRDFLRVYGERQKPLRSARRPKV